MIARSAVNARLYLTPGTAHCLKCSRTWSGDKASNDAVWHTRSTAHPTVSVPVEEKESALSHGRVGHDG